MDHCELCGAAIVIAHRTDGTRMELDTSSTGQVAVIDGSAVMLTGDALRQVKAAGFPVLARHGISCPQWWKGRLQQ